MDKIQSKKSDDSIKEYMYRYIYRKRKVDKYEAEIENIFLSIYFIYLLLSRYDKPCWKLRAVIKLTLEELLGKKKRDTIVSIRRLFKVLRRYFEYEREVKLSSQDPSYRLISLSPSWDCIRFKELILTHFTFLHTSRVARSFRQIIYNISQLANYAMKLPPSLTRCLITQDKLDTLHARKFITRVKIHSWDGIFYIKRILNGNTERFNIQDK